MLAVLLVILGFSVDPASAQPGPVVSALPTTQPGDTTTTPAPAPATALELDEFLRLVVGNNTPEARELGARSLLRNGSDEAARRLVDVLKSPNDAAAKLAICRGLLATETPPAMLLDSIIALLGRDPPELAQMVPGVLRRFPPDVVIPKLNSIAATTTFPLEQRIAAINALGFLGDDLQAVQGLITLIESGGPAIGQAAMEAMSDVSGVRFSDAAGVKAWWETHRNMKALEWLREVNQRRKEEIRRMRLDREALVARLVASAREAYSLTPESEQPKKLLAFLRDESMSIRTLALDLINGLITDRKEIGQEIRSQLLKLVTDTNANLRRRAAAIVGDLRPIGAGEVLRSALGVETDPTVRAVQINALGRLDDAELIPVLVGGLSDESRQVVAESASALGMLARRGGSAGPAATESVVGALMSRLAAASGDDELLEKFLEAMGRIGDEAFRPIFVQEMDPARSVRVRSAAITAFSVYPASAEPIRKYCTAAEPEVRLAVVQALGRCGRGREDLDALNICLDSAQEPNASVRERAWESYLSIVRRLPARDQLEVAARFNRAGDLSAQRRRADLLLALRAGGERAEPLTPAQRLSVLSDLSSAQSELREYSAAAATIDEALPLAEDLDPARAPDLRLQLVEALLRAGQDEAAVARFRKFAAQAPGSEGATERGRIAEAIVAVIESRLENADLPVEFVKLLDLARLAEPAMSQVAPEHVERVRELATAGVAARRATVQRLLDAITTDDDVDARLLGFGREIVAPELHARLSASNGATRSADEEMRLIELGKKLVSGWNGYAVGASEADRAAALSKLVELAGIATTTTTGPAT